MRDVERELRGLGEKADRDLPATVGPRPGALRRIRVRRRVLSGGVALSLLAGVAGGVVLAGGSSTERRGAPPANEDRTPDRDGTEARCGVPFAPTHVPAGFRPGARTGSGGGSGSPAAIAHFAGERGRFIDVTVPDAGRLSPTRRERIDVLGRRAVLGAIHEGYSVDFSLIRCRYQLLGYGVTRNELRDFAEGLVGTGPGVGVYFSAVWPEDAVSATRRACPSAPDRRDPRLVARAFAEEILRWPDPVVATGQESADETSFEVTPSEYAGEAGIRPGVLLHVAEVLPECWSVTLASPLDLGRNWSLGVGVEGVLAEIVFERHGATSATVEFGYANHTSITHWHRDDPGDVTTVHVGALRERDTTGHFLVILRDADGDPFTAIGRPLPPGDFAAG